ncbi:MAG: PBP1A family penicillin-binding protein [Mariprofundaceae bacterium]|nr:PBP1A family penicillin-binding protein [Mariprofundaceae bacterium]
MRMITLIFKIFLVGAVFSVIGVTGVYVYFARDLPKLNSLADYQPPLVSRVYSNQGELLAEYADQHRILTPLADIPQQLRNAFLAAEDAHFYQHPGINPARILSAALANLRAGHTVQGGSTITQQVAKNFLLSFERSYTRKIREIILAQRIESDFSKDEILYLYLNQIYLGRGAYGVTSAAWRYFHKRLDELTLAESAMLAGLPKAPGRYAPHLHPDLALKRRNTVLHMMQRNGLADAETMAQALNEPLKLTPLPKNKLSDAYANMVYHQLIRQFGKKTLRKQGFSIVIPYDWQAEDAAVRAVRKGILAVEHRQYYRIPKNHPVENWDDLLSAWAEKREDAGDKPLAEDEIMPALVLQVLEDGALLISDGLQQRELPRPKWQWEKRKAEKKPPPPLFTDVTADATTGETAMKPHPRTWIAGDEIWLQGDGKGGVRLTQQPSIESALYSIDLEKGTVLARVGGFDFKLSGFDRVSSANRQPGSAFKPFLYELAMQSGYTPASLIMDSPVVFENLKQDQFWRPENYKNRFAGAVTLRNALEHSRNLASIKLLQDIGINRFTNALNDNYLFTRKFPAQLALALGVTEVTLQELTESYAVIASGGQRWKPVSIQQIQDRNGRTLHRSVAGHRCQTCHVDPVLAINKAMQPAEQTLAPINAFLTTNMLHGVILHGTGRRARALNRPAAGKTGTTNKQVDAWFMGYTPQVLTGVWTGRDIPTSMGRRETGAHAALPTWLMAMQAFHKNRPKKNFVPPDGIEWVAIDPKTGLLPGKATKHSFLESFRIGTAPKRQDKALPDTPEVKKKGFFDLGL